MSFQPILPLGGFGGWRFLERTLDSQQDAFSRAPALQLETDHFRARISSVTTAEELVSDRQLLKVALGAFGLQDDLENRFFIRKVLEEGTLDPDSLANRLSDKRYKEMSRAFGFGDVWPPRNILSDFGQRIAKAYMTRQFEASVGDQDPTMRHALALQRDLPELAGQEKSDLAQWLTILGTRSLRTVFETAMGLPDSFAAIDLDRQVETLRSRMRQAFGEATVAQFSDPEKLQALTRRFMVQSEVRGISARRGPESAALQLLRGTVAAQPYGLPGLRFNP